VWSAVIRVVAAEADRDAIAIAGASGPESASVRESSSDPGATLGA
jgi:hypothetical protein